jgi:hypothetical protein
VNVQPRSSKVGFVPSFLRGRFYYFYDRFVIPFTVKDFLPISGLPEYSEADGLTNGKRE